MTASHELAALAFERRNALTDAWRAVRREVVPSDGHWSQDFNAALVEALNTIRGLIAESTLAPTEEPQPAVTDAAVERVARAMYDADDNHPDLWESPNWEGPEDYRRRARAALAAMQHKDRAEEPQP